MYVTCYNLFFPLFYRFIYKMFYPLTMRFNRWIFRVEVFKLGPVLIGFNEFFKEKSEAENKTWENPLKKQNPGKMTSPLAKPSFRITFLFIHNKQSKYYADMNNFFLWPSINLQSQSQSL